MCQPVEYGNIVEYYQRSNDRKDDEHLLFELYQRYSIKAVKSRVQIPGVQEPVTWESVIDGHVVVP